MKVLPEYLPSEPRSGSWIWIFSIFDTKVASTGPGTYLKRCGSKFCVGWWSEYLHSSHMEPIGEETVPHGPTQTFPKRSQNSPRASQASPRAWVLRRRDHSCKTSVWCRRAPTLGHAPDPADPLLSTTFQRIHYFLPETVSRAAAQTLPSTRCGSQDDGTYQTSSNNMNCIKYNL